MWGIFLDNLLLFCILTSLYQSKFLSLVGAIAGKEIRIGRDWMKIMPFDVELGDRGIRKAIQSVEALGFNPVESKIVYKDNAKRLLRL